MDGKNETHESEYDDDTQRFPCTEFVVHRFPSLGLVPRLELGGIPLCPTRELEVCSTPLGEDMERCEILRSFFKDLPNGIQGKTGDFDTLPIA